MASGTIKIPVTEIVSTGDNHVIANRYGNVVSLSINGFTTTAAKGWNEIVTLPQSIRPSASFYFPMLMTNTDNGIAHGQIVSSSGKLQIYNPNTTANTINGQITYLVS